MGGPFRPVTARVTVQFFLVAGGLPRPNGRTLWSDI
jgi:hypothetical protein